MGRRRGGFKFKSAKIWIILLAFAAFYKLYVFMGAGKETSFTEQLNDLSSEAFEVVMWMIVVGLFFLVFKLYRRLTRGPQENEDEL